MDSLPDQEDSDHGIANLEGEKFYLCKYIQKCFYYLFKFQHLFFILGDLRTREISRNAANFTKKETEEI